MMTNVEEEKLLEIATRLEDTLGDMPMDEADKVVGLQIVEIYKILGYKIVKRPTKHGSKGGCILLRKDSM